MNEEEKIMNLEAGGEVCACWNKKKFAAYVIWSFAIAWVLQVIASSFALQGNRIAFTRILSVSMFAPLVGSLLAKIPFKGMGWKPRIKGNIKYILMAWFGPAAFTVLGAALYFCIFPSRLDLTGQYIIATYGGVMVSQLAAQGITIPMYILIGAVQAITYGPWVNMIFALGEEVGWRGAMQPMLKERLGKTKGRIVGGIIWGAWHWPVMVLAGYEYGLNYWGAPVLGMMLFCLIAIVMGTLLDVLYEKTNCIWVPALGHGALNAIATLPLLVLEPIYANQMTVGPAPVGIISVLPALALTAWILFKKEK